MQKRENKHTDGYRICTRCVMDTSDSQIRFDEEGHCDWCSDYYAHILPAWEKDRQDENALEKLAEKIRACGKGREYDCIIGMSGGVDSSYLCYVAKEIMGLRPLVYSVDTGWNLPLADRNTERIVKGLGLAHHTDVMDWEEMRDLQCAFLKSGVPYQDLPQDHVIFAGLYRYAVRHGIRYVLTGANNATECIRPPMEWVYINDLTLIKDIQRRFGTRKLKSLPLCGMPEFKVYYPLIKGMRRAYPLNLIEYDKEEAKRFLQERFGWEAYTNKHYEDIFTRWYEGCYLPQKFGYDKRRCYDTNLILTGQMTREEALEELERAPYSAEEMEADKAYIAGKLGMTVEELQKLIDGPCRTYRDYRNSMWLIQLGIWVFRVLGIEKKLFR